jgi:hypothetical protein
VRRPDPAASNYAAPTPATLAARSLRNRVRRDAPQSHPGPSLDLGAMSRSAAGATAPSSRPFFDGEIYGLEPLGLRSGRDPRATSCKNHGGPRRPFSVAPGRRWHARACPRRSARRAGHVLTSSGQYFSTFWTPASLATRCSVTPPICTDTSGFARTLRGHGFGRSEGGRTLQTTRSSPSRKKKSGIVRGRPDRRPVVVS